MNSIARHRHFVPGIMLVVMSVALIFTAIAGADPASMTLFTLGMAASVVPIDTPERAGTIINVPVAAATNLYAGTLAALNSDGRAVNAADTAGLRVIGRVEEDALNGSGEAGAITVNIKRGVFRYLNSATAALDPDDIGKLCYVEDNQTVAETSTHLVKAGRLLAIEGVDCWVDTRDVAQVVPQADTITAAADLAALKTALVGILRPLGIIK